MNSSKRSIHNSGPLGMLVRSGQVKKVDIQDEIINSDKELTREEGRIGGVYFKTKAGIEFNEQELIEVDPKECEPWKYANRQENELGNMDELIESIRKNSQLQPALVRPHPTPHDGIKYEIIFGRRRHIACCKLGVKFLVIKKNISSIQDAVISQDAENKIRKDVSNYSNALLYKKLIEDKIFKTERELATELGLTYTTFNSLMAYSKIPADIVALIPSIHDLSTSMAIKIVSILNKSSKFHEPLLKIAPEIGKSISSPIKLEKAVESTINKKKDNFSIVSKAKVITADDGTKLFTLKIDHKGNPCFVIDSTISTTIDFDSLCLQLKSYLSHTVANPAKSERIEKGSHNKFVNAT